MFNVCIRERACDSGHQERERSSHKEVGGMLGAATNSSSCAVWKRSQEVQEAGGQRQSQALADCLQRASKQYLSFKVVQSVRQSGRLKSVSSSDIQYIYTSMSCSLSLYLPSGELVAQWRDLLTTQALEDLNVSDEIGVPQADVL